MTASPAKFDVWFLTADIVYTGVPYEVVTDWAGQGRLKGTDKVRPAGTAAPWVAVQEHPLLIDFLFQRPPVPVIPAATAPATAALFGSGPPQEPPEPLEMEVVWKKSLADDDDDPDMIPLIDISLVLLIFFMMTATVAALSPVDVPNLKNAGALSKDADAVTLEIKKRADQPLYALRLGDRPAEKDEDNLPTLGQLLARLDQRLASGTTRPPEIRIACDKALPRRYVKELTIELERRRIKGQIGFYGAEVNEAK